MEINLVAFILFDRVFYMYTYFFFYFDYWILSSRNGQGDNEDVISKRRPYQNLPILLKCTIGEQCINNVVVIYCDFRQWDNLITLYLYPYQ